MNCCNAFGNRFTNFSQADGCGGNEETPKAPFTGSGETLEPLASAPFASELDLK